MRKLLIRSAGGRLVRTRFIGIVLYTLDLIAPARADAVFSSGKHPHPPKNICHQRGTHIRSKRLILGVLALCALPVASQAGQTDLLITSGGMSTTVRGTTGVTYTNSNFKGWDIFRVTGESFGPTTTTGSFLAPGIPSCSSSSCRSDPLRLTLAIGLSSDSSMTSQAYGDASNGLLAKTSSISTALSFNGPITTDVTTASGGGPAGPSPFSLTAVNTFAANSTGTGPEPSMLLLFGSGLLLFGTIARKLLGAKREISA